MKVIVNNTDITELINISSYKIDITKDFEEWKNGNFVKKRIYTRERVSGSFEVALYGKDGWDVHRFIELWNGAVHNNIVMIRLYIPAYGREKIIEAFYDITMKKHGEIRNGEYVDIISVKLEEC